MTKQEQVIEFLKKKGFKEIESRSRKYRVFLAPAGNRNYYVGKAGAVRVGKTISKSFSITDRINARMAEEEWSGILSRLS